MQIGTSTSGPRGRGHKTTNFGGQEVKGQGHARPKFDLETWQRHCSRPLCSSSFSSLLVVVTLDARLPGKIYVRHNTCWPVRAPGAL